RRQADSAWQAVKRAWLQQADNTRFLHIRNEAQSLLRRLTDLPHEEADAIRQLESRKREVQLARFLDRYQIKSSRIPKIGSGRKAVLASFGIESAADVDPQKIAAIQGFGPTLITELVNWRAGLERSFAFNASEPLNSADVATVRTRIASKKLDLES